MITHKPAMSSPCYFDVVVFRPWRSSPLAPSTRRSRLKAEHPGGAIHPGGHGRDGRADVRALTAGGARQPRGADRAPRLVAGERRDPPGRRTDLHRGDGDAACRACSRRSPRPRVRSARRRSATAARSAAISARRSPAGDALPPLLVERAQVELASVRGVRELPLDEFLLGVKRTALEPDELVTAVRLTPSGGAQTFMKVGPRNAMVIAICSLAVVVDTEAGEVRAAFGSAAVTAKRVVGAARGRSRASRAGRRGGAPIDDVRATAAYRRHALRVLAGARAGAVPAVMRISLTVNGERREADLWGGESLLTMLRDTLELPGSKNACEQGECGSCSVLLDGELVCACLVLAAQADGHEIVTVEGLANGERLHPVQEAFVDAGAVQCGFCTPGLVVAVADLLDRDGRARARTRSARRSPATSAAAPAT